MERDLDLIRQILKVTQEYNQRGLPIPPTAIEGYSIEQIEHNINLMVETGLINERGDRLYSDDTLQYLQLTLLNKGHNFIEAAKNNSKWKKAIDCFVEKSIELTAKSLAEFFHILMKQY